MPQGLYIHIPFCKRKCRYCSFIVAVFQEHLIEDYLAAVLKEAAFYERQSIETVYFGGGTPSRLSADQFFYFSEKIKKLFCIKDGAEVSLEINPEEISEDKLQAYESSGVNRLSMGVQTFDDKRLQWLGRCHNAETGLRAVKIVQKHKSFHVNLDIMFGFPGQTVQEISQDLASAVSLKPHHIALYSLTVEPLSRFHVEALRLPNDEIQAEQYLFIKDYLEREGYQHYEVSNFALPGHESRHNINYWQGGDYIGLGVAAHSHRQGRRWWNIERVRDYIKKSMEGGVVIAGEEILSPQQRLSEALVFGLRMMEGVYIEKWQKRLETCLTGQQEEKIQEFIQLGLLEKTSSVLRVTRKGVTVLDEMAQYLV